MIVACPLCSTPHEDDARCPSCHLDPDFGPARPNPFRGATLWIMAAVLVAIYLVTLAIVAITS
jgi:hypothetical protein